MSAGVTIEPEVLGARQRPAVLGSPLVRADHENMDRLLDVDSVGPAFQVVVEESGLLGSLFSCGHGSSFLNLGGGLRDLHVSNGGHVVTGRDVEKMPGLLRHLSVVPGRTRNDRGCVTETADAVVVGAGVIGMSTALELARTGRRVVVVDKLPGPGQGSTSASSTVVRFNYSTADGIATAWEALHHWQNWADHLEQPNESGPLARLFQTGLVMLDAPVAPKKRVLDMFGELGVPYEDWDAATLTARVPGIDAGRFWPPKRLADDAFWAEPEGQLGAFFTPDAGFVDDPQLAAVNLAGAAARHDVAFWFRADVTAIRQSGGRVSGLDLADGRHLAAPVVVNVAGPWSSGLNRLAGASEDFTISVRPLRQEVHYVPAPPGFNHLDRPGPVIADLDLGIYVRGTPGDGLLVGGTEPECDPLQWLERPEDAAPNPSAALYEAQVTRAARRFPTLTVPPSPRGIVGVYDVASDWTPIYDRTALDGFYVAMGTSGNQFKNAPLAGRFMAAIINAVEDGHDHDAEPVRYRGAYTDVVINLGAFSRKRPVNTASSGTVMG
jgi:sarcosine oxidase, subunit beta